MQSIRETLCLLVAEGYLNQHLKEFEELLFPPLYLCTSCGRLANEEELLCLPRKTEYPRSLSTVKEDGR